MSEFEFCWPDKWRGFGKLRAADLDVKPPLKLRWTKRNLPKDYGYAVGGKGRAFVNKGKKDILALDLKTGKKLWEAKKVRSDDDLFLYAGCAWTTRFNKDLDPVDLAQIDLETGEVRATYPTPKITYGPVGITSEGLQLGWGGHIDPSGVFHPKEPNGLELCCANDQYGIAWEFDADREVVYFRVDWDKPGKRVWEKVRTEGVFGTIRYANDPYLITGEHPPVVDGKAEMPWTAIRDPATAEIVCELPDHPNDSAVKDGVLYNCREGQVIYPPNWPGGKGGALTKRLLRGIRKVGDNVSAWDLATGKLKWEIQHEDRCLGCCFVVTNGYLWDLVHFDKDPHNYCCAYSLKDGKEVFRCAYEDNTDGWRSGMTAVIDDCLVIPGGGILYCYESS